MNSLHVFILLELFTFRNLKKVNNTDLFNFRHIVINYISNSNDYYEFMKLLSGNTLLLDKKLCSLCFSFKSYLKKVYKVWEGSISEQFKRL